MVHRNREETSDEQLVEDFVARVLSLKREAEEAKAEARRAFQTNLIFSEFALSFSETLTGSSTDPTFEYLDHSFIQELQVLLKVPSGWGKTVSTPNNHILITSPEGDATVSLLVIKQSGAQSCLIHTYRGSFDEASFATLYSPPVRETTPTAVVNVVDEFIGSSSN
jgi:hypothetical protein